MATVYGVQATKVLTPTGANIVSPGYLGGRVRVMADYYEAAAVAADSTIHMGQDLPIGAKILNVILAFDALGSATIAVGDSTSTGRYLTATSVASAGVVGAVEDDNVDGLLYEITSTTRSIILTTASAAITGTVKLIVFYTVE